MTIAEEDVYLQNNLQSNINYEKGRMKHMKRKSVSKLLAVATAITMVLNTSSFSVMAANDVDSVVTDEEMIDDESFEIIEDLIEDDDSEVIDEDNNSEITEEVVEEETVEALGEERSVGSVTISIPDGEDLELSGPTQTTVNGVTNYNYSVTSTIPGFNPYSFSLMVVPENGVTVTVVGENGATVSREGITVENYYLVTPALTGTSKVKITAGNDIYYVNCSAPTGAAVGTDPNQAGGIYAYVPAPGQFTNDGIGSGGWGSDRINGGTSKKNMVNHYASTGVSLGTFGGSIVFDMGEDITDNPNNPYGIDFIIYGNAFNNNAEAGCVQVATSKVENGKVVPNQWYNIAGSLYYNSSTIRTASETYTNPHPEDDATNATSNTAGNVSCTGSNAFTMTGNSYHNHNWYPLNRNYFSDSVDSFLTNNGIGSHSLANSTLTFNGVMLAGNSSANNTYQFGYADVHQNGASSAFGTAQNPYTATATSTGGDGIDIAWAVNSDGTPANLSSIRFVRVYTGVCTMNSTSAFGEISTEICGIYKANGSSSTVGTTTGFAIEGQNNSESSYTSLATNSEMVTEISSLGTGSYKIKVTASNKKIFVNGSLVGSGRVNSFTPSANGTLVQIIISDGTATPYITYLKLKS